MNKEDTSTRPDESAPVARVRTKRTFSVIWVVPIVALIIGGWLIFKAMSEKGPVIKIEFENAEGLEANNTKIKFKDVEIGVVTDIALKKDLSGVVVTAEMSPGTSHYLTEATDFWVVRAHVAAGEVSGLGTLFSGAYIGCSPSSEGKKQRQFKGLEKPPIVTKNLPGRHFILKAQTLGSLDFGSPVYYRGIKVGQVVSYDFDEQAEAVLLKVFINAPYHQKVRENTRFWNASGVDLTVDASGAKLDTQSLVSIMLGGLAFDLRPQDQAGEQAKAESEFLLYSNRESSLEDTYAIRRYYLMYFDQNVRGLSPGAPVEIHGIRVGEVVSVELQFDMQKRNFRVPVLVYLEPERFHSIGTEDGETVRGEFREKELVETTGHTDETLQRTQDLIKKGFRAQLKTGNLLTGQLLVDLDFYPDAPPAKLVFEDEYPVFPTIPAPLELIIQRVEKILAKVERVPFEEIGREARTAVRELVTTMEEIKITSGMMNRETLPRINATLDEMQGTLNEVEAILAPDSPMNYNARRIADELSSVIRSARSLLEYLERDPQSLLLGKEGDKK